MSSEHLRRSADHTVRVTDLDGNTAVAFDERVLSGKVLDVVRELLLEPGHTEEVLMIIARLVHRNEDLERLVLQLRNAKNHHEHISRAQLALFITQAARAATDPELSAADEGLAGAAQPMIDAKNAEEEKAKSAPKPPPPRGPRELPANLAQVPNSIPVTAEERPCPKCGGDRQTIGHETTPVIELKPAEVFVCMDSREKLVCKACDGGLVRAPIGDKIVEGGIYGPTLVASLLTDKCCIGGDTSRRCGAPIEVSYDGVDSVMWSCAAGCGESGTITGFLGSDNDLSVFVTLGPEVTWSLDHEEYDLLRGATRSLPELRGTVVRAEPDACSDRVVVKATLDELEDISSLVDHLLETARSRAKVEIARGIQLSLSRALRKASGPLRGS